MASIDSKAVGLDDLQAVVMEGAFDVEALVLAAGEIVDGLVEDGVGDLNRIVRLSRLLGMASERLHALATFSDRTWAPGASKISWRPRCPMVRTATPSGRMPVMVKGALFAPESGALYAISIEGDGLKTDTLTGWVYDSEEAARGDLYRFPGARVSRLETKAESDRWRAQSRRWCDTPTGARLVDDEEQAS